MSFDKHSLLHAEEACVTPQDFLQLVERVLQIPEDDGEEPAGPLERAERRNYAEHLLRKADETATSSQDQLEIAGQAQTLGQAVWAQSLVIKASDTAATLHDHVNVAVALNTHAEQDKPRVRSHLLSAIELSLLQEMPGEKRVEQIAGLLIQGQEMLDDHFSSKALVDKATEDEHPFDGQCQLARVLGEMGHPILSREVYQRASRLCNDMEAVVGYARILLNDPNDPDNALNHALGVLGDAEADAQTTRDCVILALAYGELEATGDHVHELMELAEEFAIESRDKIDLARGRIEVMQDKEGAVALYEQSIEELSDLDDLIAIARDVHRLLLSSSLCLSAYDKAEQQIEHFQGYQTLLEALRENGGGVPHSYTEFAWAACERAASRFNAPAQLKVLSRYSLEALGDEAMGLHLLEKAVERTNDETGLRELLLQIREVGPAPNLQSRILGKLGELTRDPLDLIALAREADNQASDSKLARQLLERAQNRATELEHVEKISQAVEQLFPMDALWLDDLRNRIRTRKEVEAEYNRIAALLDESLSTEQLIDLAKETWDSLRDAGLVRRILEQAEYSLGVQPSIREISPLLNAIQCWLQDDIWLKKISDDLLERCPAPHGRRAISQALIDANNHELAETIDAGWEQELRDADQQDPLEWLKLARARLEDFDQPVQARTLLDHAAKLPSTPLTNTYLLVLAQELNAKDLVNILINQCTTEQTSSDLYKQCVHLLRQHKAPEQQARLIYDKGRKLDSLHASRRWVEGILTLFDDQEWARREYQSLLSRSQNAPERHAILTSLHVHLSPSP